MCVFSVFCILLWVNLGLSRSGVNVWSLSSRFRQWNVLLNKWRCYYNTRSLSLSLKMLDQFFQGSGSVRNAVFDTLVHFGKGELWLVVWLKAGVPAKIRGAAGGNNRPRANPLKQLDLLRLARSQGKSAHCLGRLIIKSLNKTAYWYSNQTVGLSRRAFGAIQLVLVCPKTIWCRRRASHPVRWNTTLCLLSKRQNLPRLLDFVSSIQTRHSPSFRPPPLRPPFRKMYKKNVVCHSHK